MIRFLLLFLLSVLWGFSLKAYATLSEQQKQALFLDSKKSTQTKKTSSSSPQKKSSATAQKKHHSSSTTSTNSSSNPPKGSTRLLSQLAASDEGQGAPAQRPIVYKEVLQDAIPASTGMTSGATPSFASAVEFRKKSAVSHATTSHTTSPHSASAPHVSSASVITPSSDTSHDKITPINDPAPITIEKSGQIPDQGLEPPPETTSSTSHGLDWLFGRHHSSAHYRYLSYSVQHAIERAHVHRGRWKYIIVHNSGTRSGNAHIFDIYHRRVRKMVHGLAYHFVIGNGHSSGDGEVEVGHRWTAQLNGGHVASDYLNDISLGICLVGDYNRDLPTKNQAAALQELIMCLRLRVGKTQGHSAIVCAHKEINPRPTDCPGKRFPYHWLHQLFGNYP
jgi:hypothetical protein